MRYATSRTMLFVSILLCPAALSPQMPPQPGKLLISSEPAGATITINGNKVSQHTNATFLVSPGRYAIVVTSQDGRLKCSGALSVSAGQTAGATCTATGWKPS
jgi:hypothetical protein